MKLPLPANIALTIKVNAKQQQRLHDQAKKLGYTASAYAQMIFDAAYGARVRQENDFTTTDADMDEMLRAVLCLAGQFDTAAISRALGIPEPLVVKVLDAWQQQAKRAPVRTIPPAVKSESDRPAAEAPKSGRKPAYPPAMVETIREMWAAGTPTTAIAKVVGKTHGALSMFASMNRDVCPSRAQRGGSHVENLRPA